MRLRSCLFYSASCLALSSVLVQQAPAQMTLDFEDVTQAVGSIPASYHGFSFTGGFGSNSWIGGGGYLQPWGFSSGTSSVYANGGTWLEFSNGNLFTFYQAFLTASLCRPDLTVRGFRGTAEVYTQSLSLPCFYGAAPTVFNFVDVDRVRFDETSVGNLMLDDIVVSDPATVTPEPLSILLLGSGLAGIGSARLRRRKNAYSSAV
jgi:hypothetical protein